MAKTSLYSFYFSGFLVLLCYVMPWSTLWALVEMPLLFAPRWWLVLLLLPVVIINCSLIIKQWKGVLVSLSIALFYLNFQLPISNLWVNSAGQSLSIMSVNLGGGIKNPNLMKEYIKFEQLTLIAFQETPRSEAEKIVPQGWDLHCIGQMCLASAYKLKYLNSQSRQILGGWGHLGLLYQLQLNEQKIYVMNLHLETPRKGFEDFQLSKLNFEAVFKNTEQRYIESSIISSWLEDKGPLIILGDFNMPVESSIYRENFGDYQNAFNEAGFGFGYTKYIRMLGIRIDHILADDNFSVIEAKIGNDVGSDHRPVIANLVLH
ncbi:MAG: endonuclease/exonuclease/phosphatase family protein [Colwellia sp.]|nr:endonuclease/exonuclease/phosphatase family protein [Colwellia sp.]